MNLVLPHRWAPRSYQKRMWQHMTHDIPGLRGIGVWHRRAGKDLLAINLIAAKAVQRVGLYWHIFPTYKQGRKVAWNGRTKEGVPFLDHFPKAMVDRKLEMEMRIHFKNGSVYEVVGTDDIDKLVGPNPVGVVFSEYALQDPNAWRLIEPILMENGGWALFISTVRGKNHFYELFKANENNKEWFCESLPITATKRDDGSPVISEADIQKVRDGGTPDAIINQEYYCDWQAALEGAIYGKEMDRMIAAKKICKVPWEPKADVDTYWDLGFGDSTCIIFAQHIGFETRIIDSYTASREAMPHYARILREKEYVYGNHWGPWDLEIETLAGGQSVLETARKLGIKFRICPKHKVADGIEQARNTFPSLWIDEKKCDRLIEALKSYRYQWDDVKKAPRDVPFHDWSSHYADAFRYMCWAKRMNRPTPVNLPTMAVDYHPPWK